MIWQVLAHAGEQHNSSVESSIHEFPWYAQLAIFFLVSVGVMTIIWLITRKVDIVIYISSFLMLIAGFAFFKVAPLISIVAITFGLISTLSVTLLSLAGPPEQKNGSKK